MPSLAQLVYKLPTQSKGDLSTLHALSSQKRASSGRYGRTQSQVSKYHGQGVGDFSAAPIQNVMSGGPPEPTPPPPPPEVPAVPETPEVPTIPDSGFDPTEVMPGINRDKSNTLGTAMGNQILENVLMGMGKSAVKTGVTGAAMGAPTGSIAQALPGIAMQSVATPSFLVNAVGGPVVSASQSRKKATSIASTPEEQMPIATGLFTQSPKTLTNRAYRFMSGQNQFGPFGDGAVGSLEESPTETQPTDVTGQPTNPFEQMSLETDPNAQTTQVAQDTAAQLGTLEGMTQGYYPEEGMTPEELLLLKQQQPKNGDGNFGQQGLQSYASEIKERGPVSIGEVGVTMAAEGKGYESSGGGGDTVICTELHRQGLLSDEIYKADAAFGASVDDDVMRGYQVWGKPVARAMRNSRLLTAIALPIVRSWANTMAGQPTLFGVVALKIGVPVCGLIGRILDSGTHRVELSV